MLHLSPLYRIDQGFNNWDVKMYRFRQFCVRLSVLIEFFFGFSVQDVFFYGLRFLIGPNASYLDLQEMAPNCTWIMQWFIVRYLVNYFAFIMKRSVEVQSNMRLFSCSHDLRQFWQLSSFFFSAYERRWQDTTETRETASLHVSTRK